MKYHFAGMDVLAFCKSQCICSYEVVMSQFCTFVRSHNPKWLPKGAAKAFFLMKSHNCCIIRLMLAQMGGFVSIQVTKTLVTNLFLSLSQNPQNDLKITK